MGVTVRNVVGFVARSGKRVAVSVVGAVLVLAGLAMLVLPGPGLLVIFAGLAVLASEYVWARRALDRAKEGARDAVNRVRGRRQPPPPA